MIANLVLALFLGVLLPLIALAGYTDAKTVRQIRSVHRRGSSWRKFHPQEEQKKPRRAFVSFFEGTTRGYLKGAVALGYSIKKNSGYFPSENPPDMILICLNDLQDDPHSRLILQKVGWSIRRVPRIEHFKKVSVPVYHNVMTKLQLWNMTEWDSLFFMDLDVVVKRPLFGIFEIIEGQGLWSLVAVRDVLDSIPFNTGVVGIRPNSTVFQDMLRAGRTLQYHTEHPTQGFLAVYFKDRFLTLPNAYNLGISSNKHIGNTVAWDPIWREAAIVHYTGSKPWESRSVSQRLTAGEKNAVRHWWNVFDESCEKLQLTGV